MKPILLILATLTLSASVDRTQSKLADRYHKHQRELAAIVEEWTAYCKSVDKTLQMGSGEPWCAVPVPAPPTPAPAPPTNAPR